MANEALLVFGLAVGILLAVAVGIDANNRDRSGLAWGLLTFFTGLIGAFIYVLVLLMAAGSEDDPDVVRVCSNCSEAHDGAPAYCSNCGEALSQDDQAPTASIIMSGERAYCSNCNSQVDVDANACSGCGAVLC